MKSKTAKTPTLHSKKRYGHHQRRSKQFHHVYLPYLPLLISIVISIIISGWTPKTGTLAYATNVSQSGLLAATNSERSAVGAQSLTLNSKLNSAAQAKANDMVARNYWSHNTPDGEEPWVFINNAGYKYLKAGENLAYGFGDSSDTIVGWMNSPSHKANMLDASFAEVGFGFANSADFNSSGEETVVVAMYGKPQTLAATAQQAAPTTQAATKASTKASETTAAAPVPAPAEETKAPETPKTEQAKAEIPFTTDTPGLEPISTKVTKAETLTKGRSPWIVVGVGILLGLSIAAALLKHGFGLVRLLKNSEQFVLHHPLFDSTIAGLIIIGVTLLQTSGIIK